MPGEYGLTLRHVLSSESPQSQRQQNGHPANWAGSASRTMFDGDFEAEREQVPMHLYDTDFDLFDGPAHRRNG